MAALENRQIDYASPYDAPEREPTVTTTFALILGGLGLAYLIASSAGRAVAARQGGSTAPKNFGAVLAIAAALIAIGVYAGLR